MPSCSRIQLLATAVLILGMPQISFDPGEISAELKLWNGLIGWDSSGMHVFVAAKLLTQTLNMSFFGLSDDARILERHRSLSLSLLGWNTDAQSSLTLVNCGCFL
jgi:hypothetical protein